MDEVAPVTISIRSIRPAGDHRQINRRSANVSAHVTPAVDQHQCAIRTQIAQIDGLCSRRRKPLFRAMMLEPLSSELPSCGN